MKPCRHLDYEENYIDCEIKDCSPHFENVKYWERKNPPYPDAPKKVQFCKLRGRINEIFACYNGEMSCYEPKEQI